MAFLVEHRSTSNASITTTTPKTSGTKKLANAFRRSSTAANESPSTSIVRRTSNVESDRRTSIAALPLRLGRRKTNKSVTDVTVEDRQATQFGRLFFSLPSEILVEIISNLDPYDIFQLRLAAPATASILRTNASAITRLMMPKALPEECQEHVQSLYPVPVPCPSTGFLLQISHRQRIVHKTIYNTLSFIQMRIFMLSGGQNNISKFSASRTRLADAFQSPAWTVYHFLESYRRIVLIEHDEQHTEQSDSRFWSCSRCTAAINDLVSSYPLDEVVGAYHFYDLLLSHLQNAIRAPNAGSFERRVRRWDKINVTNDDLAILVVFGGMEMLSKISMMQGSYDTRLKIIAEFLKEIKKHIGINTHVENPDWLRKAQHNKGVTASLDPPFAILTNSHLDRVPSLDDFFMPVWQERMKRENLMTDANDFESPFVWVQRLLQGGGDGSDLSAGIDFSGNITGVPLPPLPLGAAVAYTPSVM